MRTAEVPAGSDGNLPAETVALVQAYQRASKPEATAQAYGQHLIMQRFLGAPTERAIWYNGFGLQLYVLGMLTCAFAVWGPIR